MRRETFHTPGLVVVDIRLPRGEIEVETTDSDETVVELSALGGDSERAQRQIERAQVTLRERGDGSEIVVDGDPEDFGFSRHGFTVSISGRRAPLRVRVRAPHEAGLRVATASADSHLRGRYGDVELRSASGDIDLDDVARDAQVKVASGDLRIGNVGGSLRVQSASGDVEAGAVGGEVEIRTASGDVELGEAAHGLSFHSASGDLRVGAVTQGRVELKSASGDMRVGIRRGSRVWLDVKTMSGDAHSDLDVSDVPESEDGPLVELKATALSGDIQVVRA